MTGAGPALAEANRLFSAGHYAQALDRAAPEAAARPGATDLQMLCGMACERLGRMDEAVAYYARALASRPDDPSIRNIHANAVSLAGDPQAALALFDALLDEHPGHRDAALNRVLVCEQAGDSERALALCDEALGRFAGDPRLLSARGAILKNAGDMDGAIASLEAALAADPGRARTHHNLGVALSAAGEAQRGVAHLGRAVELGMADTQSVANWAAALLEAGDVASARSLYEKILAHDPAHEEAGRALTRLLREYDAREDAFGHYRAWTERAPEDPRSWRALVDALVRFGAWAEVKAAAEAALQRHPDVRALAVERAFATGMTGQPAQGAEALERIAGDAPALAARRMQLLAMAGQASEAARIGEAHCAAHPGDQAAWAWLATAWAMIGDPREQWLCDYDRLVRPVPVAPEGEDPAAFARRVAERLDALHRARMAPGDQSLRTGTQTSGALFDRRDPVIRALRDAVLAAARQSAAALRDDADHPFLSRKAGVLRVAGSWSVRLAPSGRHVPHFHSEGWMSSAYYARLPGAVEGQSREGWIHFGQPPEELGLDVPARRYVRPEPGMMVLFPSYMWHGTVPFAGGGDRLTAAFDFVPGPRG